MGPLPGTKIIMPREGTLVRTTSGSNILVLDQKIRYISDPNVYRELFGTNPSFFTMADNDIVYCARGAAITANPPLIQDINGSATYLVQGGQKRWIVSAAVAQSYHFDLTQVQRVDISQYPNGPNIPSS